MDVEKAVTSLQMRVGRMEYALHQMFLTLGEPLARQAMREHDAEQLAERRKAELEAEAREGVRHE